MNVFREIATQVVATLASFGLLAFFGFAFREYLRRYVDHVFNVKEERTKQENAINLELLKNRVPMVQEVVELVYRLRNQAREITQVDSPIAVACALHRELCSLLADRLYTYRALLDGAAWDALHRFKHLNQDFSILVDAAGRDKTFRENKGKFSPEISVRLQELYSGIDKLYEEIAPVLKANLNV